MRTIDWAIVALYMGATLALGLYLARRASGSLVDYFVGGRALPWWLAGTSMAATTFSIDTPLYVAGVVGNRGIAGNWEWWGYALAHVAMIYIFARLWRRAEVVTDNELTELRYGGRPAASLRAVKGFLFAVVIGSIGIGYATSPDGVEFQRVGDGPVVRLAPEDRDLEAGRAVVRVRSDGT